MEENELDIDGSVLEGGGQILRIAICMSALLRRPIKIRNIRAGRSKPGLRAQHLTGLRLVRDISHGQLKGDDIGSTEVRFRPGRIAGGKYSAEIGTAGSVTLLLQTALPCLLFADGESELMLKGGTNADMAPPIDFTMNVFQPIAQKFGINFKLDVIRRGYFPKGGGIVKVFIYPAASLSCVNFTERGDPSRIFGRSYVAGVLPVKMANAMADGATSVLRGKCEKVRMNIEKVKEPEDKAFGNGSGIILIAETSNGYLLSGSSLGKRGVESSDVGKEAADMVVANLAHGGCVDDHLQDQLIVFMALAEGKSVARCGTMTSHTETAIHVIKQFCNAEFDVIKNERETGCTIQCQGINYKMLK